MTEEERQRNSYLGDGVYAEFDGFGIWLRTANHTDELCDNKIYIEPGVLSSLNNFYENQIKLAKQRHCNHDWIIDKVENDDPYFIQKCSLCSLVTRINKNQKPFKESNDL